MVIQTFFRFHLKWHIFYDRERDCQDILEQIHANFDVLLGSRPPSVINSLTQVGYTGFRWAAQIEPFWNAYYLACVIFLAEQIEEERVPEHEQAVFSYRYEWDDEEAKMFKDSTWRDYRRRSLELCDRANYVVVTDIADFYPRIYHHRVENALLRLPNPGGTPKRIMELLNSFSKNVSYGLPIGGPASRLLAELALNAVDKHLLRRRIPFCRYADDICIFCEDRADAHRQLVFLSEKLHGEGLVLQKKKTKIQTVDEFRENSKLLDPGAEGAELETEEAKLLNISIRYDPYSDNPERDYEELRDAVSNVDIVGILGREIAKTTIDTAVTRQAINAVRALDPTAKLGAIQTLLNQENLEVLAPVFVTVMRAVKGVYGELNEEGRQLVDKALVTLYESRSYLLSVETHVAYYIQVLAQHHSFRKEEILVEIFDSNNSSLIRRLIILTMAHWNCHYWLSDLKQHYGSLNEWEKRAMIIGSYSLRDEGRHWRSNTRNTWNEIELLIRDWYSARVERSLGVPI